MRGRLVVVVLIVALACLAGCSVGEQRVADVQQDEEVPFGLLDSDVPPLVSPTGAVGADPVGLCFVDDGALVEIDRPLTQPVRLTQLVRALADPPPHGSRSLRSAVGDGLVRDVRLRAGVAQVDLRSSIDDLGGDEQLLAVSQIVCTLTGRPGVGLVSFSLDGSPVDVPRPDGSLAGSAVSRDDYAEVLP